ncbi:hypothetical protein RM96_35505 [Cupriavidus sp. IDO]|nr:hypothetical protein RM96_35505 [Cupriavidus sp. IDO]
MTTDILAYFLRNISLDQAKGIVCPSFPGRIIPRRSQSDTVEACNSQRCLPFLMPVSLSNTH